MTVASSIATLVQSRLREHANPEKAVPMAAYMKTEMPFYGVQKPARDRIVKEIVKTHEIASAAAYRTTVETLWALPHREEKYLAIAFARAYDEYVTPKHVPLYERLIRDGAWWDFVDEIAIRLVGTLLRGERPVMTPRLRTWIEDEHLWIRRTAIIGQILHKDDTDVDLLFDHCRRCFHEKDFFIRKAIGWALRDYAKTQPEVVRQFLLEHRDAMSGLSVREAAKHLDLERPPA